MNNLPGDLPDTTATTKTAYSIHRETWRCRCRWSTRPLSECAVRRSSTKRKPRQQGMKRKSGSMFTTDCTWSRRWYCTPYHSRFHILKFTFTFEVERTSALTSRPYKSVCFRIHVCMCQWRDECMCQSGNASIRLAYQAYDFGSCTRVCFVIMTWSIGVSCFFRGELTDTPYGMTSNYWNALGEKSSVSRGTWGSRRSACGPNEYLKERLSSCRPYLASPVILVLTLPTNCKMKIQIVVIQY